jgi:hypothetical protein
MNINDGRRARPQQRLVKGDQIEVVGRCQSALSR